MRGAIRCLTCGEMIENHWQVFVHRDCRPWDGPETRRAKAAAEEALQREARRLHRGFLQRAANLRLWPSGVKVTLGGGA
jgi:DNA-directed RNA polymerase subunit N (RpoN/RPB10)